MPQAINKMCKAVVEGANGQQMDVYFRSNITLYGDSTVSTATGIVPAQITELSQPTLQLNTLLAAGYLYKVLVTIKGNSTNPDRTVTMLCSNRNFTTFRTWANNGSNVHPTVGGTVVRGRLRQNRMSLR
jgi:hypothetical protein